MIRIAKLMQSRAFKNQIKIPTNETLTVTPTGNTAVITRKEMDMFESLLLASVLLITISQFLPGGEAENKDEQMRQRSNKKQLNPYHQHKKEQPRRDNLDRAATNRLTIHSVCDFK